MCHQRYISDRLQHPSASQVSEKLELFSKDTKTRVGGPGSNETWLPGSPVPRKSLLEQTESFRKSPVDAQLCRCFQSFNPNLYHRSGHATISVSFLFAYSLQIQTLADIGSLFLSHTSFSFSFSEPSSACSGRPVKEQNQRPALSGRWSIEELFCAHSPLAPSVPLHVILFQLRDRHFSLR